MASSALTRRDLLKLSAVAAVSLPANTHAQPSPAMLTRPIPHTNESLPVVGLGTWQTYDVGPGCQALDQRKEVLRLLFAAGGRMIDSSPMYGRAEEVVRTLLAEMQAHSKAFLAT